MSIRTRKRAHLARSAALRAVAFGAAWWGLAEGAHYHIWLAVLAIAAAVAASMMISPPRGDRRVSITGVLRFIAYFVARSVVAGADVARRAMRPSLPVHPGWLHFRTSLPAGTPRGLLMAALSLLPGTLSAGEEEDEIRIHALDTREDVRAEVEALERRVSAIFPD